MKAYFIGALVGALFAGPAFAFDTPEDLTAGYAAAVAAEDLDAVMNVYNEQVDSFLTKGGIATSREIIAAEWKKLFDAFDNIVMVTNEAGSVTEGNLLARWGTWGMKATPADGGDEVEWVGNYMDVLIKTEDGWKQRADLAPMAIVGAKDSAAE